MEKPGDWPQCSRLGQGPPGEGIPGMEGSPGGGGGAGLWHGAQCTVVTGVFTSMAGPEAITLLEGVAPRTGGGFAGESQTAGDEGAFAFGDSPVED
jgi:hypothetical protein